MIGTHTVLLTPDPDVQAWGPQLAPNAFLNTDLAGWGTNPYPDPPGNWAWNAGDALGWSIPDAGADQWRSWRFVRQPSGPIPRTAATIYRVRGTVTVPAATPCIVGLIYGDSPTTAWGGPYWYPGHAVDTYAWMNADRAGTFTFEFTSNAADVPAWATYLAPYVIVWPGTRPFPSPPRIASVELNGQGSVSADISCFVDEVTINAGREDTTSQPDAASATIDISTDTSETGFPEDLEVGGIIRVMTTIGDANSTRFVGRITDINLGWDDAGADTPNRVVAQVIATGPLAELGRRIVGDAPWPQQLDGARISAIMAAAGYTLNPSTSDPGTVQLLARDVDSQPALDVARGAAESAGGIVWATRTGDIRYADADHRRGTQPAVQLDACDILVTPTWARTTDGLVNRVSIGYGPIPDGGEQPRYVAQRDDSIASYGRFEFTATTELALLADAQAMANLLLTRNLRPVWLLTSLPVDMAGISSDATTTLLSLDMHDLVSLTGLPAAGNVPTTAVLWIEGWRERLAAGVHDIELLVSGYCRTSPPPRWDDVAPSVTWDTISPPSMTWDDAACLGPPTDYGRWNDVPASTRWDTVSPDIVWDEWEAHAHG